MELAERKSLNVVAKNGYVELTVGNWHTATAVLTKADVRWLIRALNSELRTIQAPRADAD